MNRREGRRKEYTRRRPNLLPDRLRAIPVFPHQSFLCPTDCLQGHQSYGGRLQVRAVTHHDQTTIFTLHTIQEHTIKL